MNHALVELKNLKVYFTVKDKRTLHAVDDLSLTVNKGETLGLVGESGCGKSTVGKVAVGLLPPTDGSVNFNGERIFDKNGRMSRENRQKIQIVFQDPYSSLNPRKTVRKILSEPFTINRIAAGKELESHVREIASVTGLTEDYLTKYPHELDGGKRQTVGIARALALNPEFVVCDEPVSALDVSIQAQIINLMMDLQQKMELTYLFISHDLSVVRHISQRIAVMYLGKVMELAPKDELFINPVHPYTQALLSAVPSIEVGRKNKRILLTGDVPSPIDPKPGCRFASRCKYASAKCTEQAPELREVSPDHFVACYLCD